MSILNFQKILSEVKKRMFLALFSLNIFRLFQISTLPRPTLSRSWCSLFSTFHQLIYYLYSSSRLILIVDVIMHKKGNYFCMHLSDKLSNYNMFTGNVATLILSIRSQDMGGEATQNKYLIISTKDYLQINSFSKYLSTAFCKSPNTATTYVCSRVLGILKKLSWKALTFHEQAFWH